MTVTRGPVRTTWLELPAGAPLRPPSRPRPACELRRVAAVSPEFCRFLYTAVGYRWNWTRRLPWSYAAWEAYLRRAGLETWVAWVDGAPGGYFELVAGSEPDQAGVEITQFGLVPRCTGRGLGGHLLCDAVRRARELGGEADGGRVWLHTCTADHPHALPNYLARGFRPFLEKVEQEELQTAGEPWPGAGPAGEPGGGPGEPGSGPGEPGGGPGSPGSGPGEPDSPGAVSR